MDLNKPFGVIYKVTNKINGKSYIGQTIQPGGFDRRYKNDLEKNTSNIHLKRAINKDGIEDFLIDKEFDVAYSKEELDLLEIKYIEELNLRDPEHGYNLREGGSNGGLADETKEKLRNANLGKRYSEEVNKKKASPGEKNGMYGKNHNQTSISLISEKRKGKYKGEDNPVSQPVRCITTNKVFNSVREAGEYYNIKSPEHISSCCYDRQKSCGKLPDGTPLEWEFVNPNVQKQFRENEGRKKSYESKKKFIVCLNDGNIFKGQEEAGDYYNIESYHHISDVCLSKSYSCGKHPDTAKPLKFIYLYDLTECLSRFIKHIKEIISLMSSLENTSEVNKSKNEKKRIICLNDCNMFESQKQAGDYYNIKSYHHISDVCLSKSYSCGKHPDTSEPLKFIHLDNLYDYLNKLFSIINNLYMNVNKILSKNDSILIK